MQPQPVGSEVVAQAAKRSQPSSHWEFVTKWLLPTGCEGAASEGQVCKRVAAKSLPWAGRPLLEVSRTTAGCHRRKDDTTKQPPPKGSGFAANKGRGRVGVVAEQPPP